MQRKISVEDRFHINNLANLFYSQMGHKKHDESYRFDRAKHPPEALCWELAKTSYLFWGEMDPPVLPGKHN